MLYHLGTENKVLLFLDIIGFSDLVKKSNGFDANDGKPHDIALIFPAFFDLLTTFRYSKESQKKRNIKFLWASDTIVISTEISNINALIEDLIYLQNQFYCVSMAFRGVITIGNLYHENNIWGEALVRAADIEKNKVKFPRVIISKEEYAQISILSQYKKYFIQDEINENFLSFEVFKPNIDFLLSNPHLELNSTVNVYTKFIIENYEKASPEVKYKWQWMAKQLYSTFEKTCIQINNKLKIEKDQGSIECNLEEMIGNLKAITLLPK